MRVRERVRVSESCQRKKRRHVSDDADAAADAERKIKWNFRKEKAQKGLENFKGAKKTSKPELEPQ